MKFTNTSRLAAVGVVAAALVAGSASLASAAVVPTVGSTGSYFLVDSLDGTAVAAERTLPWDFDASGSPEASNTSYTKVFAGPSDAETVRTFISPRGQERNPSAWVAYAENGFMKDTKSVLLPNAAPSMQTKGVVGANGVKAAGGDYSIGLAFLKTNGLYIASDAVYYTYISVTAGTGSWTFATPSGTAPTEPAEPTDPSLTGDIDLEATTIAAQDGKLSLAVAADAKATLGAPTLVDQLSKSTGTLPEFQVADGRIIGRQGWTLTAGVADFSLLNDTTKTIDAKQLGTQPKIVTAGTTSTGVVAGAAQAAGNASKSFTFAQAPATQGVGTTVLGGDLTFIAPAEAAVGTYTSKMTLTLTSK